MNGLWVEDSESLRAQKPYRVLTTEKSYDPNSRGFSVAIRFHSTSH